MKHGPFIIGAIYSALLTAATLIAVHRISQAWITLWGPNENVTRIYGGKP